MHDLAIIDQRNRDAVWREYAHAVAHGDTRLARSIYWAELANVVSIVLDDRGPKALAGEDQ